LAKQKERAQPFFCLYVRSWKIFVYFLFCFVCVASALWMALRVLRAARGLNTKRECADDFIKTKLVVTLGPASSSRDVLSQLYENKQTNFGRCLVSENKQTNKKRVSEGVDVFRLNFSHGTHEEHTQVCMCRGTLC
jgi:hypothetical protein